MTNKFCNKKSDSGVNRKAKDLNIIRVTCPSAKRSTKTYNKTCVCGGGGINPCVNNTEVKKDLHKSFMIFTSKADRI